MPLLSWSGAPRALLIVALSAPWGLAQGEGQAGAAPAPPVSAASQVVTALHEKLLEVMRRGAELGYQGRHRELAPLISRCFDTPVIAKIVLGRHWKALNDAEKAEFTALFDRFSAATYASRFSGYDGETFVEIAQAPLNRGRLLVKTELRRPRDEAVSLDYLTHQTGGEWRIIGVIANGVNDLSLKRVEYASVIKEKGYNGLLDAISDKIRAMEAGG